jgi:hypothetical protein
LTTASPARRPAAAKRAVAKKAAAPSTMNGVKPVELFTMAEIDHQPDLVEVFRIDGTPYCMDRNQDAGAALRYLKLVREKGENVALSYLFEEIMGQEAYDALINFKGITPEQLGQVMLAVQTVLLGSQTAAPKAR